MMMSFSAQNICQPKGCAEEVVAHPDIQAINDPIASHRWVGLRTGPKPIEIDARNVTARTT